jgi:hypothetical protein
MQWLTGMIGLFHIWDNILTTTATDNSGAPIPGPLLGVISEAQFSHLV